MDRDFFRRHTRFSHNYGSLEGDQDPYGSGTFTIPAPKRIDQLCTPPVTLQTHGERRWYGERSAIEKPSGKLASTKGPEPDRAWNIGIPIPANTVGRKMGSAR